MVLVCLVLQTSSHHVKICCLYIMLKFYPTVQLYAVCTLEEPIFIVTELMKHGSLLEYLRHGEGKYSIMHQMIDMIAQISAG